MPLYLVRWPRLEASIVRANDEDHLTDILDEVGDPGAASWTEYDGPLWVDVGIGIEAGQVEEGASWTLERVDEAAATPWLGATMQSGDSDTAHEMLTAVFEGAFPNLGRLLEDAQAETVDPKAVRAAALRDLKEHAPSGVAPAYLEELAKEHAKKQPGGGTRGNGGS